MEALQITMGEKIKAPLDRKARGEDSKRVCLIYKHDNKKNSYNKN